MGESLDAVRISFGPAAIAAMNVVLALVMFGIALDLRGDDFRRVLRMPRAFVLGFVSQYLVFPALSFLLILALRPPASFALGLLLVASLPAGNMSNFLTHLARGNTPLSISMTALSTVSAPIATPLVFALWAPHVPGAEGLMHSIQLDPLALLGTMLLVLALPLAAGMLVRARRPGFADRWLRPLRRLSLVFFVVFVVGAVGANIGTLRDVLRQIAPAIMAQNALALLGGYGVAWIGQLGEADRRAIGMEIAIRNAGLGLALVLTFFEGLGGMALATAWYGAWDLITGGVLAQWWARRPPA
ncbi:MAG TPA: bile acid:sodium symporter family protein [Gemmatimonadales bacterium]